MNKPNYKYKCSQDLLCGYKGNKFEWFKYGEEFEQDSVGGSYYIERYKYKGCPKCMHKLLTIKGKSLNCIFLE